MGKSKSSGKFKGSLNLFQTMITKNIAKSLWRNSHFKLSADYKWWQQQILQTSWLKRELSGQQDSGLTLLINPKSSVLFFPLHTDG